MSKNHEGVVVTWEIGSISVGWMLAFALMTWGAAVGYDLVRTWGLFVLAAAGVSTICYVIVKARRCLVAAVGYQIRMVTEVEKNRPRQSDGPEQGFPGYGSRVMPMQRQD
ncbi:MAG TPA: hypothetical protein VF049_04415 [Nocardioidaceae bacterium]|jgi:hypothetical protein